jgi:hypothetical protein
VNCSAELTHQNKKGPFVTGLTKLAGFTGLKNPVHPVNHVTPVMKATIYNQVPISCVSLGCSKQRAGCILSSALHT